MANRLYPLGKEGILDRSIDLTGVIKVLLVKTAYTYSASHKFVSDVTTGNIVARSAALSSKTYALGVFDAADKLISAVTGTAVSWVVVYNDDGATDADKRLLAYLDTLTGFPFTPTGADETIAWDAGGIFVL